MEKIYDDAKDVHVRCNVLYANADDGCLYYDITYTEKIMDDDLKEAFIKNLLIVFGGVYYIPSCFNESPGTGYAFVTVTADGVDYNFYSGEKPLVAVQAEAPETVLFGKAVSDLQTDLVVGDAGITGTLKYVSDYTDFSSDVSLQSGNYLALKVVTDPVADVITTVELVGGQSGPITLDSDMNIVLRVTSNSTQSIKVVSTKAGVSTTKTYTLTGLTLGVQE